MKKIGLLFSFLILLSAFTCEDEPLEGEFVTDDGPNASSCVDAVLATGDAANALLTATDENYVELCNAYVDALENQIVFCGDDTGSIQALIDGLGDCTNGSGLDDCEIATAAAENALNLLNIATEENYTQACNVYKLALQDQIEECGDEDGSLQQAIDNLGDCTNDIEPTTVPGTWLLTAWNGTEPIDLNNDGVESINFLEEMDCYTNETIVFNTDNTGVVMSTSYADIEIFIEVGTTDSYDFTVTCIDEIENTDMTWTEANNIVSITDEFGTTEWSLDGNTLSITIPEGFTVINTEDAEVSVIQDLTFVYTKQ